MIVFIFITFLSHFSSIIDIKTLKTADNCIPGDHRFRPCPVAALLNYDHFAQELVQGLVQAAAQEPL